MKKAFLIAMAFGLLIACNNQTKEEAIAIDTAEFATLAGDLLDQTVTIEGTVIHICRHSGKKMFISDDRVKIVVSESIASFDAELEGSVVVIKGIIREEAAPVLAENNEAHKKAEIEVEEIDGDKEVEEKVEVEVAAEDCDMEKDTPLYVIEVLEVTEKVQ